VNAVIEPIFNRIYDEVLKEKLLYLKMSAVQLRRVVEILTMMTPIMKETVGKSRDIQISVLIQLQRLLAQRGFEPKGFCFALYGFLYDKGIVHDTAFNVYIHDSKTPSPGKNSVILETNSFLLILIPGPFPDMNRDVSSTDDRCKPL
jgi:hypothetical protein